MVGGTWCSTGGTKGQTLRASGRGRHPLVRVPGEEIDVCAARELQEEAGLRATPTPLRVEGVDWAVFELVVPWGTPIAVDGVEHDRYDWVTLDEACARCLPPVVADSLRLASR